MVQRVEVGGVGDFAVDCDTTPEDIAAKMAKDMAGKELDAEELEVFTNLVIDWIEQGDKAAARVFSSCTAQPVYPIAVERDASSAGG